MFENLALHFTGHGGMHLTMELEKLRQEDKSLGSPYLNQHKQKTVVFVTSDLKMLLALL